MALYVKLEGKLLNLDKAVLIERMNGNQIWVHFSHEIRKFNFDTKLDAIAYLDELEIVLDGTAWTKVKDSLVNISFCSGIIKSGELNIDIFTGETKMIFSYNNTADRNAAYSTLRDFSTGLSDSLWLETSSGNKIFNSEEINIVEDQDTDSLWYVLGDSVRINEHYPKVECNKTSTFRSEPQSYGPEGTYIFIDIDDPDKNLYYKILGVKEVTISNDPTFTSGTYQLRQSRTLWTTDKVQIALMVDDGSVVLDPYNDDEFNVEFVVDKDTTKKAFENQQLATQPNIAVATVDEPLVEDNLDGAVVKLTIYGAELIDPDNIDVDDITLNNAPTGLTADAVTAIDNRNIEVTLAFDGTDFDTDVTDFSIQVDGFAPHGAITSNDMTITAIVE